MSWHVVGPVMRLNLEAMAKIVLLIYANETNSEGEQIGLAIETAAMMAGTSERTVQRQVKAFQADGVLIETSEKVGRGKTRIWRLNVDRARRLYGTIPTFRERRRMAEKGDRLAPFSRPGKGDTVSEKGDTQSEKGDTVSPTPIKDPIKDPARPAAAAVARGAGDDPRKNPALPPWSAPWHGVREFWHDYSWDDAKIDAWESDLYRWANNELSLNWPHSKLVMWWALKAIHAEGPAAEGPTARVMARLKGGNGGELLLLAQAEADSDDQAIKQRAGAAGQ